MFKKERDGGGSYLGEKIEYFLKIKDLQVKRLTRIDIYFLEGLDGYYLSVLQIRFKSRFVKK